MPIPDQELLERNALLDELKAAVDTWFAKESAAITAEATFLRSLVKGRGGSSAAAAGNLAKARILVIDDITTFLGG